MVARADTRHRIYKMGGKWIADVYLGMIARPRVIVICDTWDAARGYIFGDGAAPGP